MNIYEATLAAIKEKKAITRTRWKGTVKIVPTDTVKGCICYLNKKNLCNGWRPKAEDLMANDWKVLSDDLRLNQSDDYIGCNF